MIDRRAVGGDRLPRVDGPSCAALSHPSSRGRNEGSPGAIEGRVLQPRRETGATEEG